MPFQGFVTGSCLLSLHEQLADGFQIGNSNVNAFPLLLLGGSAETNLISRGAFQELDAIALLSPHTKLAIRPPIPTAVPQAIQDAYRASWYGRPGTGFVDLPADLIKASLADGGRIEGATRVPELSKGAADTTKLFKIAQMMKTAQAPLVVIGKGAAYARAEDSLRELIDKTNLFFLPTPMGKGVIPDSHPRNVASARSTALKQADVVLLLGARLNWILHFGDPPKWNPQAQFVQVDISADEVGRNKSDPALGIVGDIAVVVPQLIQELGSWSFGTNSDFEQSLAKAKAKNEATAVSKASSPRVPMSYNHAFTVIEQTLRRLSHPDDSGIVYVSEGANTMDISRSIFTVNYPRLRLDAGTYATMGVGLGYAIAAHAAYNGMAAEGKSGPASKKKIVALEGDSAFGFSAMEVETMARYGMDVLIFVMNNGGVYHGDSDDAAEWLKMQQQTESNKSNGGLRSTSLGWEVQYEQIAEACGGKGYRVRTSEELRKATEQGFDCKSVCVVNVLIESGKGSKLEFGWQASGDAQRSSKL